MKRLTTPKALAIVAIALGALNAASTAHAHSDVSFSIGVQVPGFYVQTVPVYAQPRPIYRPAPVYYGRYNEGRHHGWQRWQGHGPYGDFDRDGIRNKWDRDIDGDGVRNRYDRAPVHPNRR